LWNNLNKRNNSAYAHSSIKPSSNLYPVLPVINFSPFACDNENDSQLSTQETKNIIQNLANACEHVGFFYAIGHGISNNLLTRTLAVTREFFNLDLEIKNKYAVRQYLNSPANMSSNQRGGFGRGYQSLGENVTNQRRDRHEGFDLYRELESNHPIRKLFEQNPNSDKLPDYRELAIGYNPYPQEPLPSGIFYDVMSEYIANMKHAGERIMRAIALSLNLPLNYFASTFNDSFWVIRCIRYPAVEPSTQHDKEYGEGCGEHSDYGWLTFVNQDLDSKNCLYVKMNNEQNSSTYVSADPIIVNNEIALTCNIGDILSFITQGKYRSTLHRVSSPIQPARDRVSVPFFLEPNADVKLKTDAKSPECYYGEYLINKVRRNFQFQDNNEQKIYST
ncbi:unnamed protein product, partial [Didymodactylos carnosus]